MTKTVKSDDYDLRRAIVSKLLAAGIPRSDIRHEITLDTASSGGRADIVLLRDGCLTGFELKSGKDNLDRCKEQKRAYKMAFDRQALLVDERHIKRDEHDCIKNSDDLWFDFMIYREGEVYGKSGITPTCVWPNHFHRSHSLSADRMLSLLWAPEVCGYFNGSTRHKTIEAVAEQYSIKEIRKAVVASLRQRRLNRWEKAFWDRFDVVEKVAA
ncbi:MAG: hypothetical protein KGL63_04985 [Betaproteobacteria bacterium]|nr:hypothetical protein [Betaproteobacteria bacterium]